MVLLLLIVLVPGNEAQIWSKYMEPQKWSKYIEPQKWSKYMESMAYHTGLGCKY
jgi:hypothetical protein